MNLDEELEEIILCLYETVELYSDHLCSLRDLLVQDKKRDKNKPIVLKAINDRLIELGQLKERCKKYETENCFIKFSESPVQE